MGLSWFLFREILDRKFFLELDRSARPVDNRAMRGKPRHAEDDIKLVIQIEHDEFIIERHSIEGVSQLDYTLPGTHDLARGKSYLDSRARSFLLLVRQKALLQSFLPDEIA